MTVGKFKFLFERWRGNIGIISLLLMIRLNMLDSPIWWGWFVIGFVVSVIYLWFDMKYIYPKEASMGFKKNPEFERLIKMVEEINNKIR